MVMAISYQNNSYSNLKAVLNAIVKLCNQKKNLEFQQCVKAQKKHRIDFQNKLNDYFNTQQQQFYERIKQKCMNKNDEELIECLLDQNIDQQQLNNKMQEFKQWRRNMTKTLI